MSSGKIIKSLIGAVMIAFLAASPAATLSRKPPEPSYTPGQVVLRFQESVDSARSLREPASKLFLKEPVSIWSFYRKECLWKKLSNVFAGTLKFFPQNRTIGPGVWRNNEKNRRSHRAPSVMHSPDPHGGRFFR
jgi:hypothetical protein